MKIRQGFVSNSSSTSFYCQICGTEEELLGDVDPHEADMFCCENGHEFHIGCLPEGTKLFLEEADEVENTDNIPTEHCPICNFEIIPKYLVWEYLKSTTSLEVIYQEIKNNFSSSQELKDYIKENKMKKHENQSCTNCIFNSYCFIQTGWCNQWKREGDKNEN